MDLDARVEYMEGGGADILAANKAYMNSGYKNMGQDALENIAANNAGAQIKALSKKEADEIGGVKEKAFNPFADRGLGSSTFANAGVQGAMGDFRAYIENEKQKAFQTALGQVKADWSSNVLLAEKDRQAKTKTTDSTAATLSGAVSGASVGTAILPGWGTLIGALAGGLYGNYQDRGGWG